ncbi:MAG: hypothetical protein P1V97_22215 [Planctomycetota bacterium]|nr:hypothetical protein [Planctomycetota bacterium]
MKTWPIIVIVPLAFSACQSGRPPRRATTVSQREATPKTARLPKKRVKPRTGPIIVPAPRFKRVISIDVVDTLLSEVIADIREQTGAEIYVDPRVDRKITMTLRDLPWRDIVRVIARVYKLELKVKSKDKFVFYSKPKTNIEFADANLRTALLMLAKKSGQNIIIAPEVQGKVSARLEQVSAADALRALAKNAGHEVVSADVKTSSIQGNKP